MWTRIKLILLLLTFINVQLWGSPSVVVNNKRSPSCCLVVYSSSCVLSLLHVPPAPAASPAAMWSGAIKSI